MNRLFQALSTTADGAFVVDKTRRILFWNAAAGKLTGYGQSEARGMDCQSILGVVDESGKGICCAQCRTASLDSDGLAVPSIDIAIRTRGNGVRWINMSTFAYPLDERETLLVHLFREATNKKQANSSSNARTTTETLPDNDAVAVPLQSPLQPHDALTRRENQVLMLLVRGQSTQEIAETLVISKSTARNHIRHVLSKLDVHSRLGAVSYAIQHGLVAVGNF